MAHETYNDKSVQKCLAANYIAIHLDAEAEPDLGERYGFWGWPALIFLNPKREHVGFHRGFRPAATFNSLLNALSPAHYQRTLQKADIDVDLLSQRNGQSKEQFVELTNAMIDRFYDPNNHGWSGARMADQFLVQQAWWRGSGADKVWRERALATSRRYRNMLDPVWGGVWFGSRSPQYDGGFIHEKRTEHQASALVIFARGYHYTGEPAWLSAIANVEQYLNDFMSPGDAYLLHQPRAGASRRRISAQPSTVFCLER